MEDAREHHYFGNAWRSLASTRNIFGKLCLLTLVQLVPVLGQIVTLGYFLGWAREATWKMEAPLPAHVLGRDDSGFWSRGVKGFFVVILYGIISSALFGLLAAGYAALGGLIGSEGSVPMVAAGVFGFVATMLGLLLTAFLFIGLLRMAVYDRFGAAFQWGFAWRMTFHYFGGLFKLFWTYIVASLVMAVVGTVVACALVPGLAGVGIGWSLAAVVLFGGDYSDAALALLGGVASGSLAASLGTLVVGFFLSVLANMVNALMWRAFGNWFALYDVPRWGASCDPLPYLASAESETVQASEQAESESGQPQAEGHAVDGDQGGAGIAPHGAPEYRSSPFLNALAAMLIAFVGALASTVAVVCIALALYSSGAVDIDLEGIRGDFVEQSREIAKELGDLFGPDWFADDWLEVIR